MGWWWSAHVHKQSNLHLHSRYARYPRLSEHRNTIMCMSPSQTGIPQAQGPCAGLARACLPRLRTRMRLPSSKPRTACRMAVGSRSPLHSPPLSKPTPTQGQKIHFIRVCRVRLSPLSTLHTHTLCTLWTSTHVKSSQLRPSHATEQRCSLVLGSPRRSL